MYVIICKKLNGRYLFLERGEFSWVPGRIGAVTYPTLDAANAVADKVNKRTGNNVWRGPARAVFVGA